APATCCSSPPTYSPARARRTAATWRPRSDCSGRRSRSRTRIGSRSPRRGISRCARPWGRCCSRPDGPTRLSRSTGMTSRGTPATAGRCTGLPRASGPRATRPRPRGWRSSSGRRGRRRTSSSPRPGSSPALEADDRAEGPRDQRRRPGGAQHDRRDRGERRVRPRWGVVVVGTAALLAPILSLAPARSLADPSAPAVEQRRQPPAAPTAESEYNRGIRARTVQDWQTAEAAFRRAIALRANFPDAWNELGFALRNQGRYPESLQAYDQALRLRPE